MARAFMASAGAQPDCRGDLGYSPDTAAAFCDHAERGDRWLFPGYSRWRSARYHGRLFARSPPDHLSCSAYVAVRTQGCARAFVADLGRLRLDVEYGGRGHGGVLSDRH